MQIIKSDSTARKLLRTIWFFFSIGNFFIILYLYFDEWIEQDSFYEALKQLNTLYAPYIGAIILFYFGTMRKRQKNEVNQVGTAFTVAFLCSLLWNGIITFFILRLILQIGTIEEAIENIQFIGGLLSWLPAGAIGYYFANSTLKNN